MSYGVNTWAAQPGRAPAAGSSKRASTRTAKRRKTSSVRRAKKRTTKRKSTNRRSLPEGWGGTLAQYQAYQKRLRIGGKWTEESQGRWL